MVAFWICPEPSRACLLVPGDTILLLVVEITPLTFVLNCFLVLLLPAVDPLLVVLQSIFSECLIVTLITLEVGFVVSFLVPV